jgi:hypothetical protein
MTQYTYIRDIPNGPNDPADDQPNMKINTNSTDSIFAEDHYSFNVPDGGFHKQVRMDSLLAQPTPLPTDGGTLYVKDSETAGGVLRGQLFFASDNVMAAANEFQITRTIPSQFGFFGTNGSYTVGPFPIAPATANGGWTFLPGGLIMMYGIYQNTIGGLGTSGSVSFPFSFPNTLFNVQISIGAAAASTLNLGSTSLSGFNYFSTAGIPTLYWTAIGN